VRYELSLPFPISTNAIWRSGWRGRVRLSDDYKQWKAAADSHFYLQKRSLGRIVKLDHFRIQLIFDDRERRNRDGDNLIKCVLDWLQRIEIVRNDCLCDGGSWEWGTAPAGCRVIIEGELYVEAKKTAVR
jgi:Holliday junction resolvase RusA-like endonuclease